MAQTWNRWGNLEHRTIREVNNKSLKNWQLWLVDIVYKQILGIYCQNFS